jgi:hypothetical protein
MKLLKETLSWLKYGCIVILSYLTCNTVVNWFGSTYLVSGNVVMKIR